MILAAGRGERMRPLTDRTPKPLLPVAGKPLIVWHLERLAHAGFDHIVINHAHLGDQIEALLGKGDAWGVSIRYSPEPASALETAGGIAQALALADAPLGDDAFLVVNGDIYCEWDFGRAANALGAGDLAHLVLVPNPAHHPAGDFALEQGRVADAGTVRHTFAGIGIYRRELFAAAVPGKSAPLAPLLRAAMAQQRVSGELHTGRWVDVGTPQRLTELDVELRSL